MRPYNHIKAKHASLTLKYYTQMDMVSQTSKREREREAVQADFTIPGKSRGLYRKKGKSEKAYSS